MLWHIFFTCHHLPASLTLTELLRGPRAFSKCWGVKGEYGHSSCSLLVGETDLSCQESLTAQYSITLNWNRVAATVGKISSGYESQGNFLRIADIFTGSWRTSRNSSGRKRRKNIPDKGGHHTWMGPPGSSPIPRDWWKGEQGWNPQCGARNDGKWAWRSLCRRRNLALILMPAANPRRPFNGG